MKLPPAYALLAKAINAASPAPVDYRQWDDAGWDAALGAARWHRLAPTLFCHLRSADHVPADVIGTLEQEYLAGAARSLYIRSALRRVLDVLAAAEVRAMLLKGAALVETVYSDPAQREMLDLDLLVPADGLDAANAALATIGYRPVPASARPGHTQAAMRVHHHHDPALVGEEQIVAVELHHHIAMSDERTHFDVADLWDRARAAPHAPAHALPAAEDLLLHVCFHFTRNRLGGSHRRRGTGGALGQLCDIARIVEGETIDWDALVASARAYRLDSRVFLALFAAREIDIAVPDPVLAQLRPRGFDAGLGRRLVALRVLRTGDHLPVRSVRWMLAPGRDVLTHGWGADPEGTLSLARAYVRRAQAQAPRAGAALRRPWSAIQDRRLNAQIHALQPRE